MLVLLHPTSGYSEIHFYFFEIYSEIAEIHVSGIKLLTGRINNTLEKSNLINEHALNREPESLIVPILSKIQLFRNLKVY